MRLADKHYAIRLRMQGLTCGDIRKQIPFLPKGTLSGWLKNLQLTREQLDMISKNAKTQMERGRLVSAEKIRNKKLVRLVQYSKEAKNEFSQYKSNPLFLVGLTLYWAEGAKTNERFQFANSEPALIKLMIQWLELVGRPKNILKFRLYTHTPFKNEHFENFWSKTIQIPLNQFLKTVYKSTPHTLKKNPLYRGCMRIDCRGVDLFYKIVEWKKCLAEMYNCNPSQVVGLNRWEKVPS